MTAQIPLQSDFALVTLQRDLLRLIVDGDESIESAIESTADLSAATRLRIYSDAYRLRLIEALQANYPVLERLLGIDRFARITQLYLSVYPSQHFSIRWFGHELARFLRELDECRDEPWLAELADWEWKVAAAFDERDVEILTVNELATLAPEDWPALKLFLCPGVRRIGLATNVAKLVKAASEDRELPAPALLDDKIQWLIWRQDLIVRYRSLDTLESAAIDALQVGSTFGELCEVIAQHIDTDAVPLQAATFIRQWIEEQLLAKSLD